MINFHVSGIKREEDKIKRSLKDAAKKGHKDVCATLAKEIVRSRKAVTKIHTAKAQIKSVEYSMSQQLGKLENKAFVITGYFLLIVV